MIRVQRRDILRLLKDNPGLKSDQDEAILYAYENGKDLAMGETHLPEETFPHHCSYSSAEILDHQFYPGEASK